MSVFSLRLREPGLRDLVREVAHHEDISQNELIEQAVANEVLLRGATLVADLERAAERLAELTDSEHARIVDDSLTDFAEGEGLPEPLQAYALDIGELSEQVPEVDSLGVIAAFNSAHP
jgi:predicted transcriptional regulator